MMTTLCKPYLTEREKEVLRLVASGKVNKEIAVDLSIATVTVDKHMENIRRRLKATTGSQAVAIAIREGIL